MDDLRVIVGAASDAGAVREQNEDALYVADPMVDPVPDNGLLLALADGMGGYQRGEVASQLAIETLREVYYAEPVGPTDIPQRLKRAFRTANERIFAGGSAAGEENMMGTTLVAAVIRGVDLTVANVGDSRAYLVRAKRATQGTRDHSLVAEQVAAGTMTETEARESQHRNIITRALGHRERVDVDIFEIRLLPDDRLLLTSDGLHDYVTEDELVSVVLDKRPEEAARELVNLALAHESNDNVSAVVAWMAPVGAELEAVPAEAAPSAGGNLLLMIILTALVVFVAIIAVVLYLA